MYRKLVLIQIISLFFTGFSTGQVKIRLSANHSFGSAVFTAIKGRYVLDVYDGKSVLLNRDEPVIFAVYNGKVAVKIRDSRSFVCDSVIVKGLTGRDFFSLRINGSKTKRTYSGNLQCRHDLGHLFLIDICDVEQYIAGVVKSEGGADANREYLKTQAVLARTYMYRYFDRHIIDGYNVCDNTHCQAFNGIAADSAVVKATLATKGLVVLDQDSALIMSAFHSNCGGETSSSADVWLSAQPYLKKVIDPYCISSHNAKWSRKIPVADWENYMKDSGYSGSSGDHSVYDFSQTTRTKDYSIGSFTIPFRKIRTDLNLRSSFFSVRSDGDAVVLNGRGYGHGVGLCQEGAMVMASRGFKFGDIIKFYYSGVIVSDIKDVPGIRGR